MPPERRVKWLVASGTGATVAFLVMIAALLVSEALGDGTWIESFGLVGVAAFGLIPAGVGVAVLRHRLYDIDRIISRTVTYGLVTALLLAAYASAVFVFRAVVPGQSDLAVAASTLAVAPCSIRFVVGSSERWPGASTAAVTTPDARSTSSVYAFDPGPASTTSKRN